MIFNSFLFWLIFPLIFCGYWFIPSAFKEAKKWFLIVVSYLLYINWKPAFALALFFVTIITFYGAKWVSYVSNRNKRVGGGYSNYNFKL